MNFGTAVLDVGVTMVFSFLGTWAQAEESGVASRLASVAEESAGPDACGPARQPSPARAYAALQRRGQTPSEGAPSGGPGRVNVWACGDNVRVNPETGRFFEDRGDLHTDYPHREYLRKSAVWDADSGRVSLSAARNEFVAFQVIVEVKAPTEGIRVALGRLRGPGGAEMAGRNIALFKAWYVQVKQPSSGYRKSWLGPGWYPDALLPVPAAAPVGFDIPDADNAIGGTQNNQSVWVDLYVPRDQDQAPPGKYTGPLQVSWPGGKREIEVELTVWDFALPDEIHCRGDFFNGSLKTMDPELELRYYQLCHQHRFQPGVAFYRPEVKIEGTKVTLDWTSYDARIAKYLDGSAFTATYDYWGPGYEVPLEHLLLPFDCERGERVGRAWPIRTPPGGPNADYEAVWIATAQQFLAHFDGDPLWRQVKKVVFIDSLDESYNEEAYAKMRYYSELLRRALPPGWFQFRIDGGYSRSVMETLYPHVDLWVCHTAGWDHEKMAYFRQKGVEPWFYGPMLYEGPDNSASGSNTYLDLDLLTCRSLGWTAWKYQCGYCEWEFDWQADSSWTEARNFENQGIEYNGVGLLIYRGQTVGAPGPIPSIRLKAHRRGFQDYEYFWLLARKTGRQKEADQLVDSIFRKPPLGPDSFGVLEVWKGNPEAWDAVRVQAGELLSQAQPAT